MLKKSTSILLLFSFWFTFLGGDNLALQAQESNGPSRIAVFPFADTNAAAKQAGNGEAIAGMLMTELINSKTFQVVERSEIQRIIDEIGLGQGGIIDASTAKEIGKIYGVDNLVFGSVAKFGSLVEADIRLVETESGEALLADNASCRGESEIRNMVKLLSRKIEKRFLGQFHQELTIESTPAGAKVFINGKAEGETPLVTRLAPGSYAVKLQKTRYESWEKTVAVIEGKNQVTATLVEISTVPQVSEPPEPPLPEKQDKGSSKTMLYILGGAALVGGGIAAAVLLSQEEDEKSNVTVTVTLP